MNEMIEGEEDLTTDDVDKLTTDNEESHADWLPLLIECTAKKSAEGHAKVPIASSIMNAQSIDASSRDNIGEISLGAHACLRPSTIPIDKVLSMLRHHISDSKENPELYASRDFGLELVYATLKIEIELNEVGEKHYEVEGSIVSWKEVLPRQNNLRDEDKIFLYHKSYLKKAKGNKLSFSGATTSFPIQHGVNLEKNHGDRGYYLLQVIQQLYLLKNLNMCV